MSLADHALALADSLAKANLVPGSAAGLIPADFKPTTQLGVSFGGRAVALGNHFPAGQCKEVASISFGPEEELPPAGSGSGSYTFMMVDPDAPTPADPKFAFWRHWVLGGLKPSPTAGDTGVGVEAVQTKPVLTEYLGPGPKEDSGPHRYLFLLFREPQGLDLSKDDLGGEEFVQRRSFKPAEFAEKHGLTLVGVNWMTCAWDGWTG